MIESDADFLRRVSVARGVAHRATFAEWSKDHKGHSAIVQHTRAWADKSNGLLTMMPELKRRGLALPECDCSAGSHLAGRETERL